jgi:hypothetical protein
VPKRAPEFFFGHKSSIVARGPYAAPVRRGIQPASTWALADLLLHVVRGVVGSRSVAALSRVLLWDFQQVP